MNQNNTVVTHVRTGNIHGCSPGSNLEKERLVNRVVFIDMPFAGVERPALGVSLLKSNLARFGVESDIVYLNMVLAEMIGLSRYCAISNTGNVEANGDFSYQIPIQYLPGDWVFSQYLYGIDSLNAEGYLRNVLAPNIPPQAIHQLLSVRSVIGAFIDHCTAMVNWNRYTIVGFTTTYEQNMASLCLAKRIKERYPRIVIVFGGANCNDIMGRELHCQYPFIDVVCVGEGDKVMPPLVQAVAEGRSLAHIKGIVWRNAQGDSIFNEYEDLVSDKDFDELPTPDFDDYFTQLYDSPLRPSIAPLLTIEGSRGCWWGAKNHCVFCGLNDATIKYRKKHPSKVIFELKSLVARYGVKNVTFTDNIMDYDGIRTFVPELIKANQGLQIFSEIRPNFKREQVRLLAEAGINYVQPGIESLSSVALQRMGKGTTALQNVAFLKWCRIYSITPFWNLLLGFPGEELSEYETILNIMRCIVHLQPPGTIGKIRMDRFSPYYVKAKSYGFKNVRPISAYHHVYNVKQEALKNICYFFDAELEHTIPLEQRINAVGEFWNQWKLYGGMGTFVHIRHKDGSGQLYDTRFNRRIDTVFLEPFKNVIYEFCDQPRKFETILRELARKKINHNCDEKKIREFLSYLCGNLMMVQEDGHFLSVAIQDEVL